MAERWTIVCAVCGTKHVIRNRGRGRMPKVCSEDCRTIYKKKYHKTYDARTDQKERRRKYMKTKYRPQKLAEAALEKVGYDAIDRAAIR